MERYIKPEMEIIHFDVEDVIVTSGDKNADDDYIVFPFIPLE